MIEVTECKGDQKEKIQIIEPKVSKKKKCFVRTNQKIKGNQRASWKERTNHLRISWRVERYFIS